jgi:hypothetical protein
MGSHRRNLYAEVAEFYPIQVVLFAPAVTCAESLDLKFTSYKTCKPLSHLPWAICPAKCTQPLIPQVAALFTVPRTSLLYQISLLITSDKYLFHDLPEKATVFRKQKKRVSPVME